MAKTVIGTRMKQLLDKHLESIVTDPLVLVDNKLLERMIDVLPDENVRDAMHRFYILGETQQKTGDSTFYENLKWGRRMIVLLFQTAKDNPRLLDDLMDIVTRDKGEI